MVNKRLWKNWWKTTRNGSGKLAKKLVDYRLAGCSGCSVWWKNVRFSKNLFGSGGKKGGGSGKHTPDTKYLVVADFHKIHTPYDYYYK